MKVDETHLRLAADAVEETMRRFTANGIDRGALVMAFLSVALKNIALIDGPKDLAEALHRFAHSWDLKADELKPTMN